MKTPPKQALLSNKTIYSPRCKWAESKKRVSGEWWDRSWFYGFGVGSGRLAFRAVFCKLGSVSGYGDVTRSKVQCHKVGLSVEAGIVEAGAMVEWCEVS